MDIMFKKLGILEWDEVEVDLSSEHPSVIGIEGGGFQFDLCNRAALGKDSLDDGCDCSRPMRVSGYSTSRMRILRISIGLSKGSVTRYFCFSG